MYEKKIAELMKQLEDEKAHSGSVEEQLNAMKKLLSDQEKLMQVNYRIAYGKANVYLCTSNSINPFCNKSSVGISVLARV